MMYRVVRSVTLIVGKKKYHKDNIITADMVGQIKINRYLRKGFIEPVTMNGYEQLDATSETDALLSVDEVNALDNAALRKYALALGIKFSKTVKIDKIRADVIEFVAARIDDANDEDSDTDDSDSDQIEDNA